MSEPVITDGGSTEVVAVDHESTRIAPSTSSSVSVRSAQTVAPVKTAPAQQVTVESRDALPGPPGRDGTDGQPGQPGPAGPPGQSSNGSYVHTQNAPAAVWTVVHNLGFFPNVTVEDSAGTNVEGETAYVDANTLILTFTAAFGGTAYLS